VNWINSRLVGHLCVLPSALLAVVVSPVIARSKLRALLDLVLGAMEFSALNSAIPGDCFSRLKRRRH
jgi:hypothetical protein